MQDTVVLDGSGKPVIEAAAGYGLIEQADGGAAGILEDGAAGLIISTDAEWSAELAVDGECGIITSSQQHDLPYYTGPTEVTPSNELQRLMTANMALSQNITINPIPSNYGLITWNGSMLTVS